MSKLYKALIQERADLTKEQKALFSAADASGVELTAEQKQRDDAIYARLQELAPEIERQERRRENERTAVAVDISDASDAGDPVTALKAETLGRAAAYRAGVPYISGGDVRAAAKPFRSLGENMLEAVRFAQHKEKSIAYRQYEANVQKMLAATGLNETVGSEGGVLVQTDYVAGVLRPLHDVGPFTSRARNIPVSTDANGIVLFGVDETSRANGSRWGGVRGYRVAETGTLTKSQPAFRKIRLELKKYGVLGYSTDELLRDASAMESVFAQAAGEELSFMANDDLLNGDGNAGPLGVLNAGALVSQAKESGQAAATVVNANLVKMWQRMHPSYRANAVWYINSEVEPQLDQLSIPVGAAALEPRYVAYRPDGVMTIKGKPVVVTEFNAALGTVGDIVLANFADDYITIDKGGVQYATSLHLEFLTDQMAFRWIYRFDGQPVHASAITPYKGSNTQSAFVALATRA